MNRMEAAERAMRAANLNAAISLYKQIERTEHAITSNRGRLGRIVASLTQEELEEYVKATRGD